MTIQDQIRDKFSEAISKNVTSQYRCAKETGIPQSCLSQFLRGGDARGRTLTLIAKHVGMKSVAI